MNKFKNVILGLLLVILGVVLALKSFDLFDFNIFFDGWWTLIIIIPCFIDLFTKDDKKGSIIGIIIGLLLLGACQDFISFSTVWKLILPIILIIIGISFICKTSITSKIDKISKTINNKNECTVLFSGQDVKVDSEFEGANLTATFGAIDYNLVNAKLKKESVINVQAIFGGVDIIIPKDTNVILTSTGIFGGTDNKVINNESNKNTIYINSQAIFGGVEIKCIQQED